MHYRPWMLCAALLLAMLPGAEALPPPCTDVVGEICGAITSSLWGCSSFAPSDIVDPDGEYEFLPEWGGPVGAWEAGSNIIAWQNWECKDVTGLYNCIVNNVCDSSNPLIKPGATYSWDPDRLNEVLEWDASRQLKSVAVVTNAELLNWYLSGKIPP